MDEIETVLGAVGASSPLVTLLILWKIGLIGNGKKNGEYKDMLLNHEARLEVANREMGEVKVHLSNIKEECKEINNKISDIYKKIYG